MGGEEGVAGLVLAALEIGALVGTLAVAPRLAESRPERVAYVGTALYGLGLML
ncbi:hypothetical protein GCM10012275_29380 [Longimycelium tulufanense]|uniref:Uncharacterized protein n=1 Tax=Longimycelium tulufanense TaxID=907463 RepID=A0A8J3FWV1_9PSEU|nr:hypothetical protein GCM10012275_29380 [Longimycelium tulufanense]